MPVPDTLEIQGSDLAAVIEADFVAFGHGARSQRSLLRWSRLSVDLKIDRALHYVWKTKRLLRPASIRRGWGRRQGRLFVFNARERHRKQRSYVMDESGDRPVAWSSDSRSLWIFRRAEIPTHIDHLEIATGRRQRWKTLMPADPAGVYSIDEFQITPSGHAYFYNYRRVLSELYVVQGLR